MQYALDMRWPVMFSASRGYKVTGVDSLQVRKFLGHDIVCHTV